MRVKYKIFPQELGGRNAVVRKCQNKETGEYFAIKTIHKVERRLEILRRQIDVLKFLDHPNIIKLIDLYEDESYFHLVTHLCTGEGLFDSIVSRSFYSESDASPIVYSLLSAMEYLHTVHNVSHRDLNPGKMKIFSIIFYRIYKFY